MLFTLTLSTELDIPTRVDKVVDNIFPQRIISKGNMQIALHELSHNSIFLTDITMNEFSALLLNQFAHIKGMQGTIRSQVETYFE
ncbi:hypothetical protein LOD99_8052 [Oopsacas minuta]|uniref:Uncharacterized protein n=1 Tax=Oopsacas minuta TaxID=111878 RepID=A0AAV7JI21_9METZ|nr:hypothetical protein LOD99_8052 [Oopsacas minuta]